MYWKNPTMAAARTQMQGVLKGACWGFMHSTNEANESSHQQRRTLNVLYLRARQTTDM